MSASERHDGRTPSFAVGFALWLAALFATAFWTTPGAQAADGPDGPAIVTESGPLI